MAAEKPVLGNESAAVSEPSQEESDESVWGGGRKPTIELPVTIVNHRQDTIVAAHGPSGVWGGG